MQKRTVLIASNAFKDSLTAREACEAIAEGARAGISEDVSIVICPLADGGDSFIHALCLDNGGRVVRVPATDPLGRTIEAGFGIMKDGSTAVIEAAAANGLRLVPTADRNPMKTTTAGVGDLILAALALPEITQLIVGVGGSATNDGGIGMAARLGAVFTPSFPFMAGEHLNQLTAVQLDGLNRRLREIQIKVACDVDNPLFGERGAARIFGKQKGGTPDQIAELDRGLEHLADVLAQTELAKLPGMGAAGGLSFGLAAFCGGTLTPGCKLVMDALGFPALVSRADLIITGEGSIDSQSLMGKVPVEVARIARQHGKPCIALVGHKGDGWEQCVGDTLLTACHAVTENDVTVAESMADPKRHLAGLAEVVIR